MFGYQSLVRFVRLERLRKTHTVSLEGGTGLDGVIVLTVLSKTMLVSALA